jgi:hypothetical protein
MAVGVPVACSNVTSLPEIAGDAAILFDPRVPEQIAQAMITLAREDKLTAQMVKSGEIRAANFSDSELMARQYWKTFQNAVDASNPVSILVGAYPDGWAAPHLRLRIAPAPRPRFLELEMALPDWVPLTKVTLTIRAHDQITGEMIIKRGQSQSISVPVPSEGAFFDLALSPAFIPAFSGIGDDRREISCLLTKCAISDGNGQVVVLFPEKAAA